MNDTGIPNHDFLHLTKTAYSLADTLACTPEIKEIYIPNKDMTLDEWTKAVHLLLALIDQLIINECGIPVFQLGLHSRMQNLTSDQTSKISAISIPKVIQEAVMPFGNAFCQMVKEIQLRHRGEADSPPINSEQPDEASDVIIDLCKQMVNLIINELGLKSADLAKIY